MTTNRIPIHNRLKTCPTVHVFKAHYTVPASRSSSSTSSPIPYGLPITSITSLACSNMSCISSCRSYKENNSDHPHIACAQATDLSNENVKYKLCQCERSPQQHIHLIHVKTPQLYYLMNVLQQYDTNMYL